MDMLLMASTTIVIIGLLTLAGIGIENYLIRRRERAAHH